MQSPTRSEQRNSQIRRNSTNWRSRLKKKKYQPEKPISISVEPIEYYDGDPLIRIRLMPSSTVIALHLELQGKGALSGSYTANQSAIIHPFFNRGPLARSVGRL